MQAATDAPVSHAEKKVRLSEPELGQDEDDERSDADSVVDEEGIAEKKNTAALDRSNINNRNDPIDKNMILAVINEISPDDLELGGDAIVHVLHNIMWKMANDTVYYGKTWRGLGRYIAAALGDESEGAYMDYYTERRFDDKLTHVLVDKAKDAFVKKGLAFSEIVQ